MSNEANPSESSDLSAAEQIRRCGPTIRPDELARVLRVTPQTIRRQCVDGTIRATRIGKVWRVERDEALRVLAGGAC